MEEFKREIHYDRFDRCNIQRNNNNKNNTCVAYSDSTQI